MDMIYDLVESIHVFIPIIAVVSLVLIVYFCGIGRAQQPPDDYIEKIHQVSSKSKKKSNKPSKFVAPSKSSDEDSRETTLRHRGKSEGEGRKSGTAGASGIKEKGASVEDKDQLGPAEGEWVTVTPKKKGRRSRQQNSDTLLEDPGAYVQIQNTERKEVEEEKPVERKSLESSKKKSVKKEEGNYRDSETAPKSESQTERETKTPIQQQKSPKKMAPGNGDKKRPDTRGVEEEEEEWQTQTKKGRGKGKKKEADERQWEDTRPSQPASASLSTQPSRSVEASLPRSDVSDSPSLFFVPASGAILATDSKGSAASCSDQQTVQLAETPSVDEGSVAAMADGEEGTDVVVIGKAPLTEQEDDKRKKKKKKKGKDKDQQNQSSHSIEEEEVEGLDSCVKESAAGGEGAEEEDGGFIQPKKPSRPRARRV